MAVAGARCVCVCGVGRVGGRKREGSAVLSCMVPAAMALLAWACMAVADARYAFLYFEKTDWGEEEARAAVLECRIHGSCRLKVHALMP